MGKDHQTQVKTTSKPTQTEVAPITVPSHPPTRPDGDTTIHTYPKPSGQTKAHGPLNTAPDNPAAAGAIVGSNNTAEVQALIELLDDLLLKPSARLTSHYLH